MKNKKKKMHPISVTKSLTSRFNTLSNILLYLSQSKFNKSHTLSNTGTNFP